MQDQLLPMKPILLHQQRFLDQHADVRIAERWVMGKQLVRIDQGCTHDGTEKRRNALGKFPFSVLARTKPL